jgi:hypothetical protein
MIQKDLSLPSKKYVFFGQSIDSKPVNIANKYCPGLRGGSTEMCQQFKPQNYTPA